MPIFNLFSKRQKKLRGEMPDVYLYDTLPESLRVQLVHIVLGAMGNHEEYYSSLRHSGHGYIVVATNYKFIVDALCREYGVFRLDKNQDQRMYLEELLYFFLQETNIDRSLDVIEMCFGVIDKKTRRPNYLRRQNASAVADDAIQELNQRFQEHGVGYRFENGQIVRVDSQLIHSEVVKPALMLLGQRQYAGARQEFLQAHEHYRAGRTKEALNECLKAFESVMKSICYRRGWSLGDGATAKALIQVCFDNQIVPPFWQSHFSALRSLLESGIPTGRNKLSGHGQGAAPTTVPMHLVGYVLHMTAAAIVFLAEADADMDKR